MYDVLGNVKSRMVTDVGVSDLFTTFYDHDSLNRVKTITERTSAGVSSTLWAQNKRVVINHDKLINSKRTTEIHRWEPQNLSSPLDTEKVGKSEYIRHDDGRLNRINHYTGTNASAIDYQAFTYDNYGRVRSIADPINTNPVPYDTSGQITEVDGRKITYDASGNPVVNTGPYNRLNSDPFNAYTYDNEGNIVTHRAYEQLASGNASNSINLGTETLTRNWYRLVLDHIVSNKTSFTVKLYAGSQLVNSFPVSSFTGDNNVICFDFFLSTGIAISQLTVQFDNSPTISAGTVYLNKLDAYRKYTWDHKNRLVQTDQFTVPATGTNPAYDANKFSTTKYRYDVYGNRIEKEILSYSGATAVPHAKDVYVPENGHTLMEYEYRNNSGTYKPVRMAHNLYSQAVDQLLATDSIDLNASGVPTALKTVWSLTDYQNTVKMLLSKGASSFTSEKLQYDVFGKPQDLNKYDPLGQPNLNVGSLSQLVSARYAGREFDYDTGLQYNRARYYNPTSGRWMSEDPIGFAGGDYNLYRYCGNSHTNGTDPSGNIVVSGSILIAAMLYGTYAAHRAEAQYNEASTLIGKAVWTPDDVQQINSLVDSANWNLASANITANAGKAYLFGLGIGAGFAATAPLGLVGFGMRTSATVGFLGYGGYQIGQMAKYYPQMSSVERYEALGSLGASLIAGYAGFRGMYNAPTIKQIECLYGIKSTQSPSVLYTYSPREWQGNTFFARIGGRAWATIHEPGPWAFERGFSNTVLRMYRTGRISPFKGFTEITGPALNQFTPVQATGVFSGWKHLGGQYYAIKPGNICLTSGTISKVRFAQFKNGLDTIGSDFVDFLIPAGVCTRMYLEREKMYGPQ